MAWCRKNKEKFNWEFKTTENEKKSQNFYIRKSWKTFQLVDFLYSKYLVNSIRIKNNDAK